MLSLFLDERTETMNRRQMMTAAGAGVFATAAAALAQEKKTASEEASAHVVCCDCVENKTSKPVIVHLVSAHGEATFWGLPPGKKWHFQFVDDKKLKVLAAFNLDNTLVATYPFFAIKNPAACLPVQDGLIGTKDYTSGRETSERASESEGASNRPV
ncbi:MAG: hypothetical protein KY475_11860 [Planctomycetes bacterium]|nr:hypothetical protein [Planctomycetota bacterium]